MIGGVEMREKEKENVTERDAAALNAPARPPLPTLTAIKAELQSNESRHRLGEGSGWTGFLLSLLCVMSTANGQQMWGYFTSVALEKHSPRINPIRSRGPCARVAACLRPPKPVPALTPPLTQIIRFQAAGRQRFSPH